MTRMNTIRGYGILGVIALLFMGILYGSLIANNLPALGAPGRVWAK